MTESSLASGATTMKAVVYDSYGTAEGLQLRDVARPTPEADEVLVRVRAASVGAWDWHDMRGEPYVMRLASRSLRRPRKEILGLDMAGDVVAVGAEVSRFDPGDRVYGARRETFAEYAVAEEEDIALVPPSLGWVDAAAVPVAGATALLGLRDHAHVQPGETVLIVGAAGGVGSFAVQIANSMGAEVTGVCSPESADLVRSLGADHVIDYTTHDFTTSAGRYDVIFQIAGAASAWACRRALTPRGRLILCSGDGGGRLFGPIGRILLAKLISPFVSQAIRVYVANVNTEILETLTGLIEAGHVAPLVDTTFPLARAADALRRFEDAHTPGKIVLTT